MGVFRLCIAGLFMYMLLGCQKKSEPAKNLFATTISIIDGDTFTILVDSKIEDSVRLYCIDAPEKEQGFGQEAKEMLESYVWDKEMTITKHSLDQYGRIIGEVQTDDGYVNLKMVQEGMAWVYRDYCNDCDMYAAEREARNAQKGLWAQSNPIPPWAYRKDPTESQNVDWSSLYKDDCTKPDDSNHNNSNNNNNSNHDDSNNNEQPSSCGNKKYCSEMVSCDEALFYYSKCGVDRLDGDGDGVPCESLCN